MNMYVCVCLKTKKSIKKRYRKFECMRVQKIIVLMSVRYMHVYICIGYE